MNDSPPSPKPSAAGLPSGKTEHRLRSRNSRALLLAAAFGVVLALGLFLRLSAGPDEGRIGKQEAAYRGYLNDLIRGGLSSSANVAERYVEVQRSLPTANPPPTRPLFLGAAHAWHRVSGDDALAALRSVSCAASILTLVLSGVVAWRLGGWLLSLGVSALMATAPGQIAAAGVASGEPLLCALVLLALWACWETFKRPRNPIILASYLLLLTLLSFSQENTLFLIAGFFALLATNHWINFGQRTWLVVSLTVIGPVFGVAALVYLCGSGEVLRAIIALSAEARPVSTEAAPYMGDLLPQQLSRVLGPNPLVILLALGVIFTVRPANHGVLFLLIFTLCTLALLLSVGGESSVSSLALFDPPLRYLAVACIVWLSALSEKRAPLVRTTAILLLCAIDLHQAYRPLISGEG